MNDAFEQVFSVNVPPERAWSAMTDPAELEIWFAHRFESGGTDGPSKADTIGGPVGFEVVEFELHQKLRYKQWAADPATGIDVTVVFESEATGTRITYTAHGFGGESIFTSDATRRGMREALSDLVTYLNRGMHFARHHGHPARAWVGARFSDTFEGAVVAEVEPDGFAARLGLLPGDLVLLLDGGCVFSNAELTFCQRIHEPGDEIEVVWARDRELMEGRAPLGRFEGMPFATRA